MGVVSEYLSDTGNVGAQALSVEQPFLMASFKKTE